MKDIVIIETTVLKFDPLNEYMKFGNYEEYLTKQVGKIHELVQESSGNLLMHEMQESYGRDFREVSGAVHGLIYTSDKCPALYPVAMIERISEDAEERCLIYPTGICVFTLDTQGEYFEFPVEID